MNVIAGTASGAAGVLAGHPFDTVKVRLQAQAHSANARFKSTWHCFRTTLRHEGPFGLFKGVSSPLVGVTAINTLLFGVYGFLLESQSGDPNGVPTLGQIFVAGAGSGLLNSLISGPVELAKIQVQNQIGSQPQAGHFRSPSDCLRQVYRHGGVSACYRGLWTTVMRETPSYGVYFAAFEGFRLLWTTPENGGHLDNMRLMLAGGLSGIAAWMSTYPIDVVKTRIQAQPLLPGSSTQAVHLSTGGWLRKIVREEGLAGLFRGTTATVVRAFPTNAVIFSTYALTMRWLDSVRPAHLVSG